MAKFVFFAALILFLVLENDGASVGSNTCGDEECKFGSYCSLSASGEPKCVCPMACTMEYRPVCGSDGNTYGNLCNLEVKSCQQKKFITVIKEGACSDDDELKQRIAEDESELESEQLNNPPYLDPELMNTLNPEGKMSKFEEVEEDKKPYPMKGVDEKTEPIPTKSDKDRLLTSPDSARDMIQAEINRLAWKYSEQLPGIELLKLPAVEFLELYSETELAGDILCILTQIEIVVPQVQEALDEFIARYGEEIGVYSLKDFEITNEGSGSGDGSGIVQSECPVVEVPYGAVEVEMMNLEGDAMTELSYFVETLLLSEISLYASLKSKYI